jgi:NADPH2:quinone reductase
MSDLPQTMRALVIDAPGAAPRVETRPVPSPGPGEVLVRIAASPINPSDLMTVQGLYGVDWTFPLVAGLEGSGRVVARGDGLLAKYLDNRNVACVADKQGLWAEYAVTKAARCLALPADMPLGPAAMSFVNPLTAVALVRTARRGGHASAISTAAGGALGRMIEARGKQQGLTIINVVRRSEQAEEMRASGLRHVLASDAPDFDEALSGLCRDLRCRMAFDAVGGALTGRLVEAMRRRSEVLVYGALAMEAVTLNPGTMIFKGATVRGFWLSDWLMSRSFPQQLLMARSVLKSLRGGFAQSRVAGVFDLEQGAEALAAYTSAMSAGKVLFAPSKEALGWDRAPTGGQA